MGEQRLNTLIAELRKSIESRDESYRTPAKDLYQALITPIEEELSAAKIDMLMLYLVDALRYLPFAALHDGSHFLIQNYSLTLYTAAARESLKDAPTLTWSAAALGVTKAHPGFGRLHAVDKELRGIVRTREDRSPAGIMTGTGFIDDTFTREQFKAIVEGQQHYPVIHIATHFHLAPGSDEESFLLLGDGQRLTLREIWTAEGTELEEADLMTLSACETALANDNAG